MSRGAERRWHAETNGPPPGGPDAGRAAALRGQPQLDPGDVIFRHDVVASVCWKESRAGSQLAP